MALARFHGAFAEAVSGGDAAALCAMLANGDPCGLSVYRNNSARALIDALASNYPAVRRLVGEGWFADAASAYVRSAPSYTRTLVGYGESFPDFLAHTPLEMRTPAYLADVARLDRAWLEAHLAGDEPALAPEDLADLSGDALAKLHSCLHASARLIGIGWTIYDIWDVNRQTPDEAGALRVAARSAQTVLVWRHDEEVAHRLLSAGEAAFLNAVARGANLGQAARAAEIAGEAPASVFAGAIAAKVFAALKREGST
jgi:hypothetical protein